MPVSEKSVIAINYLLFHWVLFNKRKNDILNKKGMMQLFETVLRGKKKMNE